MAPHGSSRLSIAGTVRSVSFALLCIVPVLAACRQLNQKPLPMAPSEVSEKFYRWYTGYLGNPLVDAAYRDSPYLAQEYVERVDAMLAATDRGGADPFLLAQDVPERFEVRDAEVESDSATVWIDFYWSGSDIPLTRIVVLTLVEDEWRIVNVTAPSPGG